MSIKHPDISMKEFFKYTVTWISQNLAVPFWSIGHIHLMTTVYEDIHELLMSFGMNLIVAIGFIINYLEEKEKKSEK